VATGTVAEFSEPRGIGAVAADGTRYPFHCTQIADGTRTVRVGARVEFDVVPGRRGDWEATRIVKLDGPQGQAGKS
jgi:cold shock CspA family protein